MAYRIYMRMAEQLRLSPRWQARPAIRALWRVARPPILVWCYFGLFCATIFCEGTVFSMFAHASHPRITYASAAVSYAVGLLLLCVMMGIRIRRFIRIAGLVAVDLVIALLGTLCMLLLILWTIWSGDAWLG